MLMTRVIAVIRYLILLVILYLLYLFNNHAVTLMLLVVALIVPILSFLCFFLSCKKIVFGISFRDAVVNREEPTAIVLSANNKSIIPQLRMNFRFLISNELITNNTEHIWELFLGPKENMKVEVPLKLVNSGSFHAKLLDVTLWDAMGILKKIVKTDATAEAIVLPVAFSAEGLFDEFSVSVSEEAVHERNAKGNDTSEIFEIRNYRSGDRPQQIHWKLSAKEQELMVKEFADLTGEMFEIFLCQDFRTNAEMDAYFDVMYSVGMQLCKMNIAFSYGYLPNGSTTLQQVSVTDPDKVRECLFALYYVKPKESGLSDITAVTEAAGMRSVLVLTCQPFAKKESSKILINKENLARLFLL